MRRWIARLMVGPAVFGVALIGATPFLSAPSASAAPTATSSTTNYPPAAGSLGSSSSVSTPGGTITLSAAGLKYPESCVITIDGETIGHANTSPDGKFQVTVTIPSNIPPGEHTIIATCNRGDVVTTTIDIQASSGTAPAGGGGGGGGATLAFTGTDSIATAGAGASIIAIGGLLVLATRRRRRSNWGHGK